MYLLFLDNVQQSILSTACQNFQLSYGEDFLSLYVFIDRLASFLLGTTATATLVSSCSFLLNKLPWLVICLPLSLPILPHQWRVRKEAMMGLASIYRKYSLQGEGGREASKQISWIKDKLLHIYYQNSIDDRFVLLFVVLKSLEKQTTFMNFK